MPAAPSQTRPEPSALVPDEVLGEISAARFLGDMGGILSLHPEVAAAEQIGSERHYRYDFADVQVVGHGEACQVAEGILLQIATAEARWPRVISVSCPDVMRIRIGLEGAETFARPGEPVVQAQGPTALVVVEPPGQPEAQVVYAGRQVNVTLILDRDAVQRLWAGRENELPGLLQDFVSGTLARTEYRRLSLKSDLLRCLEDLLRCEQDGLARTLYLRSKGVEIVCHVLKMLQIDESFGAADATVATAKGVIRAQQILRERFATPPSLDDLARAVGVSRSGLCAGFRQIVGQSIGGFIQELRMERALELLTESADPITEIAYAVGYCHQSSFTVAVQRRFGMSPTDLRRTARPALA